MEIKNSKCPINGFKPCDDECAWYNANGHIGHCAVLDINDCANDTIETLDEIRKKLNEERRSRESHK